jgi:hypothetical protein
MGLGSRNKDAPTHPSNPILGNMSSEHSEGDQMTTLLELVTFGGFLGMACGIAAGVILWVIL